MVNLEIAKINLIKITLFIFILFINSLFKIVDKTCSRQSVRAARDNKKEETILLIVKVQHLEYGACDVTTLTQVDQYCPSKSRTNPLFVLVEYLSTFVKLSRIGIEFLLFWSKHDEDGGAEQFGHLVFTNG